MIEIEKMYKLAKVKAINIAEYGSTYIPNSVKIDDELYPSFTTEKQIELIKWLIRNKRLFIRKADYSSNFYMDITYNRGNGVDNPKFESCLASLINDIWQSLTDQEKEEIRGIF